MKTTGLWLTAAAIAVFSTGALAQPGKGKGDGRGNDQDRDDVRVEASVNVNVNFSSRQRDDVSVYLRDRRDNDRGNCPPGLAKKNNGCMPPGQAKRYQLGRQLPRDIVIGRVPEDISVIIGLPPAGYEYGMIDGDLVKLVVGTLLVVDAIDGL